MRRTRLSNDRKGETYSAGGLGPTKAMRNHPSSHFYFSQRLRLHYVSWGNADDPAIILVHGGRDHCRNWDWVAQSLSQTYHVIAPDLRGHGDSDWVSDGQYAVHGFVYDLAELIEHLNVESVNLLGHSLGGSICLRYAALFPDAVRGVIAIEGLGAVDEEGADGPARTLAWIHEQRRLARLTPVAYPSFDDAVARMRQAHPQLDEPQAEHLTRHGTIRNDDGSYRWKFDNYVRSELPFGTSDLPSYWKRVSCPVLLAYGTASWASNPAEDGRLRYFRNARVELFEGAGHWLQHDDCERFVAQTRSFLQQESV